MSYDVRALARLGLVHELIGGVDADAPGAGDVARVRRALGVAIADARSGPPDSLEPAHLGGGAGDPRGVPRGAAAPRGRVVQLSVVTREAAVPPAPAPRPEAGAVVRAHDLLALAERGALRSDVPAPGWVLESLGRAPLVVVRRAPVRGDAFPVGVRGAARHQRFAAWVPRGAVAARIRPEELAQARAWRRPSPRTSPPLAALEAVEAVLAGLGLSWGPVGSAGFELASGVVCTSAASDLDLLVRAPAPLPRGVARLLVAALSAAVKVRVDVQLETPAGGVALAEYAAGTPTVVARTADGPLRIADPWLPRARGGGAP